MNAHDILKYGHETFIKSLESIAPPYYEKPGASGTWSVKDILAHIASSELVLVEVLENFCGGHLRVLIDAYQKSDFNETQVQTRKNKYYSQIFKEYMLAQNKTLELIAQIPAEKLRETGTLPWYGNEYSLEDFIVYAFYGHKREHSAQINSFGDSLPK